MSTELLPDPGFLYRACDSQGKLNLIYSYTRCSSALLKLLVTVFDIALFPLQSKKLQWANQNAL